MPILTTTVTRPVLETYQGDFWQIQVTFKNADGTVVDLTGVTLSGGLVEFPGGPVTALTLAIPAPTTGVVLASLTSAQTLALHAGKYFFDIRRVDVGSEATFVDGTLVIKRSIHGAS